MPGRPRWSVEFYVDSRDHCPVIEYLSALATDERAKCARALALLSEFGTLLRMPHARPIGALWELRADATRLFYVAYAAQRFIVLHAYRKQGQKAPKRKIELAERRLADFLERHHE